MNHPTSLRHTRRQPWIHILAGLALSAMLAACASTSDRYPPQSDDGLVLRDSRAMDAVYWREGATLSNYERVNIAPTSVAFRKNWQRDQNMSRDIAMDRVDEDDMARIRSGLAEAFNGVFTKELQDSGGYTITDDTDSDVLLLRPAIVDLDVNAPDVSRDEAGVTTTYARSAGEMTLNMELYDAVTGDLIGRVIDHRKDIDSGSMWRTNSVTNLADARRLMQPWAKALREALDEAHGRN